MVGYSEHADLVHCSLLSVQWVGILLSGSSFDDAT